MIKKLLLFFSISILAAVSLSAQNKKDVLLKFSQQDNMMRIVLETEDFMVNRAKITTSNSQMKIEFPDLFNLTSEKTLPFDLVPHERLITINLKESGEIKFFKLTSPARLVFDIQKKEAVSEKQGEKPEAKQTASISARVIVIDAGHGGYEFGITSGNVNEKDICLHLSRNISSALLKKGKKVYLTRKADQFLSLNDRINFVNQKMPDIFLSLHISGSKDFVLYIAKFEDQGLNDITDIYSLSSRQKKYMVNSRALAESLGKAIKEEFNMNVTMREMPLPILNSVGAPAVLLEIPYPKDMIYDQETKAKLENTIVNGFVLYEQ